MFLLTVWEDRTGKYLAGGDDVRTKHNSVDKQAIIWPLTWILWKILWKNEKLFLYVLEREQETHNSSENVTYLLIYIHCWVLLLFATAENNVSFFSFFSSFLFLFFSFLQQSRTSALGPDGLYRTGLRQPVGPYIRQLSLWFSMGLHKRGRTGRMITLNIANTLVIMGCKTRKT